MNILMCLILQRYKFESNSQPVNRINVYGGETNESIPPNPFTNSLLFDMVASLGMYYFCSTREYR